MFPQDSEHVVNLIESFCQCTGAGKEVAIQYLTMTNYNTNEAVMLFLDESNNMRNETSRQLAISNMNTKKNSIPDKYVIQSKKKSSFISDETLRMKIKQDLMNCKPPMTEQEIEDRFSVMGPVGGWRFYEKQDLIYKFQFPLHTIPIFFHYFEQKKKSLMAEEIYKQNQKFTFLSNTLNETGWKCIQEYLPLILEELHFGLIGRQVPIKIIMLALLSQQHVLLTGPPGTAKSEMAKRVLKLFGDDRIFHKEMTRFTTPEELFGPISVKMLKEDEYRRNTEKYLPTSTIAFLDEIFKSNSAILNSLLTIMNERTFTNGSFTMKSPLLLLIAASNERPTDLDALYDRFLFRYQMAPLNEYECSDMIKQMLGTNIKGEDHVKTYQFFNWKSVKSFSMIAEQVEFDPILIAELINIKKQIGNVSDRRLGQIVRALQTCALCNKRMHIAPPDLMIIKYMVDQERVEDVASHLITCIKKHRDLYNSQLLDEHLFIELEDKVKM